MSTVSPVMALLPELQPAGSIPLRAGDVIISAAGFEDRTLALAGRLEPGAGASAILLQYSPSDSRNRTSALREALRAKGVTVEEKDDVVYERFDPADFEVRLATRLETKKARRVLLDISTMSKLQIMLVLNVLRSPRFDVSIFYAEAASYGPSESDFESARRASQVHQPSVQIYTGVHGVVRVDSLASVAMQGHQTAAIVFMSFNDSLTQVLLNTVYPGRLFLVNGRPPEHHWRERATAWIHEQVRQEWQTDNPLSGPDEDALPARVVSTLDYRQTVVLVLELYWHLSASHRILLAPAGSKLQAVGCFFAKALHPDIHIEYPTVDGFAVEYSSGIGKAWSLDLKGFASLLRKIAATETREFLEIHIPKPHPQLES